MMEIRTCSRWHRAAALAVLLAVVVYASRSLWHLEGDLNQHHETGKLLLWAGTSALCLAIEALIFWVVLRLVHRRAGFLITLAAVLLAQPFVKTLPMLISPAISSLLFLLPGLIMLLVLRLSLRKNWASIALALVTANLLKMLPSAAWLSFDVNSHDFSNAMPFGALVPPLVAAAVLLSSRRARADLKDLLSPRLLYVLVLDLAWVASRSVAPALELINGNSRDLTPLNLLRIAATLPIYDRMSGVSIGFDEHGILAPLIFSAACLLTGAVIFLAVPAGRAEPGEVADGPRPWTRGRKRALQLVAVGCALMLFRVMMVAGIVPGFGSWSHGPMKTISRAEPWKDDDRHHSRGDVPSRECRETITLSGATDAPEIQPTFIAPTSPGYSGYYFSPDSELLAVAGSKQVDLYTVADLNRRWSAAAGPGYKQVAWSESQQLLAVLARDGFGPSAKYSLAVLNAADGSPVSSWPVLDGDRVCFLDENFIVVWTDLSGQPPHFFDLAQGREVTPDEVPAGLRPLIFPLKLVPHAGYTGGNYKNNVLMNTETGDTLALKCTEHCFRTVSPDGRTLYSGSHYGRTREEEGLFEVIDLAGLKKVNEYRLSGHGGYQLSADGSRLMEYGYSKERTIRLFEAATGKMILEKKIQLLDGRITLAPDNRRLAVSWSEDEEYGIRIEDLNSRQVVATRVRKKYKAGGGVFLSDDTIGFIDAGEYVVLDYVKGIELKRLGRGLEVRWARPAPDGQIIGLCRKPGDDGELHCLTMPGEAHSFAAALSPQGDRIALDSWKVTDLGRPGFFTARTRASVLEILDVRTGKWKKVFWEPGRSFHGAEIPPSDVEWVSDGRIFFLNGESHTLGVYDPRTESIIMDLADSGRGYDRSLIRRFEATKDAGRLVTYNMDTIEVWDPKTLVNNTCITVSNDMRGGMIFNPRDGTLAVGQAYNILLLDLDRRAVQARLPVPFGAGYSISFSQEGEKLLVTGGEQIIVYKLN